MWNEKDMIGVATLTVAAIVMAIVLSFMMTAGLVALICWAFALEFTWKIAFGVWVVAIMTRHWLTRSN